ncbi:hypothetical protein PENANT_c033G03579 [Penicillium antarcticum]|uniref:Uncharacterized protein n=1 Tax=Penicillium antarcticum TaxID=416450 RepID=A0A1V6PVG4_9EURO|nr:uncharacterized protein N7508_000905 [Penicillium antarcticum]KAJ5320622.1 hypothetical protein N7508_000905 [Penicillium antarcticum]OQD80702.1 hypothetical protein PENANT_c033G03579 [Penicillium antarcticum]
MRYNILDTRPRGLTIITDLSAALSDGAFLRSRSWESPVDASATLPAAPAPSPVSESSYGSAPMSIPSESPSSIASPDGLAPLPIPSEILYGSGPRSMSSESSYAPAPAVSPRASVSTLVTSHISTVILPFESSYSLSRFLDSPPRTFAHTEAAGSDIQPPTVQPSHIVTPLPFHPNNIMPEVSEDLERQQRPRWQDSSLNPAMSASDPILDAWNEARIQASEDELLAMMATSHNNPPHHFTNDGEMSDLGLDDLDGLLHEMETGMEAATKQKPATPERPTKRTKGKKARKSTPAVVNPEVTRTLRSNTTQKTAESAATAKCTYKPQLSFILSLFVCLLVRLGLLVRYTEIIELIANDLAD